MASSHELAVVTHEDGSGLRKERLEWTCDCVFCESCGEVWVAVRSVGSDYQTLDCPNCGAEDSQLWEESDECDSAMATH